MKEFEALKLNKKNGFKTSRDSFNKKQFSIDNEKDFEDYYDDKEGSVLKYISSPGVSVKLLFFI